MKSVDGIKKYDGGFSAYYDKFIQPRILEMNELMAERRGLTTKIKVKYISDEDNVTVQEFDEDGELTNCNHADFETELQEGDYLLGDTVIEYSTDNNVYYCNKCGLKSFDLQEWSL